MKARKNPTLKQMAERLRRQPPSNNDARVMRDSYWALRAQGFSHSYAKRAIRSELPKVVEYTACELRDSYIEAVDPEDILFAEGTKLRTVRVAVRPPLTEATITNAQPRASEYTIWHEGITGFGLRVRPSGHKSFVLLYRVRGETKLRKITLGRVGDLELSAAKEMASKFRYRARSGEHPNKPAGHKSENQFKNQ
jgi:hypothetical protein